MSTHARVVAVVLSLALAAPFGERFASAAPASLAGTASTPRDESLEAPAAAETFTVGTLRVQRYGDHGRPLILIPGTEGGSWEWRGEIQRFRGDHVIYAVTLAGFDDVPAPKHRGHLFDQTDASLAKLIRSRHIETPVLIGHSLGGGVSIRFAELHPTLISGVISLDAPPVFPGMEDATPTQREAFAKQLSDPVAKATPQQRRVQQVEEMRESMLDPAMAARYARLNARSDQATVAQYLREAPMLELRPGLKNIRVPVLLISPYYAPDFSKPPMQFSEAGKAAHYKSLLVGARNAQVLSISPSRHYVMFDQPAKLDAAIADFLERL